MHMTTTHTLSTSNWIAKNSTVQSGNFQYLLRKYLSTMIRRIVLPDAMRQLAKGEQEEGGEETLILKCVIDWIIQFNWSMWKYDRRQKIRRRRKFIVFFHYQWWLKVQWRRHIFMQLKRHFHNVIHGFGSFCESTQFVIVCSKRMQLSLDLDLYTRKYNETIASI